MADKTVNLQEKLKDFRRVWDRELRQEIEPQFLLSTLTTLSQILTNVVEHPDEEKYRKIPASNKRIVETVIDRKGGKSYLLCCGFVKKSFDGKDFWYLPVNGQTVEIIKIALELIDEKKNQSITAVEAEKKRDLEEKEKNAQRAAIAKQQFEEDRSTFQERLQMTGGTKESVAQPFRDLSADARPQPGMHPGMPGMPGMPPGMHPGMPGMPGMPPGMHPGMPGMHIGGNPPAAAGGDDDADPPAPTGGHVLGGD